MSISKPNNTNKTDMSMQPQLPKNPYSNIPLEQFIEFVRAGVDVSALLRMDSNVSKSTRHIDNTCNTETPQEQLDELRFERYNNNVLRRG